MATLNIYIDGEKPNYFKVLTINFEDTTSYSCTHCHNENEVLDKVKDFLSKNKVKDKPYTGDILFVSKAPTDFTPNKIYHIQDGIIKDNTGYSFPCYNRLPFISFEDVKEYFSTCGRTEYNNTRFSNGDYTVLEVVP